LQNPIQPFDKLEDQQMPVAIPTLTNSNAIAATATAHEIASTESLSLQRLTSGVEAEVLKFLGERPLHTAVMSGFIRDNGLDSEYNRGAFYACRNARGNLEGVALIGHAMFVEARTSATLRLFAQLAQNCRHTHMLLGESEKIEQFWNYYSDGGQPPRLFCREVLFEQRRTVKSLEPVADLRLATVDDLALIVPVHAALAYAESGVNPLDIDPRGFQARCERRIKQNRVWVCVRDSRLLFKTDIVAATPQVTYLEGVYVEPAERSKGFGTRCLTQMNSVLLQGTEAISVLVNAQHSAAQAFFQKAAFIPRGHYDTIFLRRQNEEAGVL
jgi:predicted GNAT family acetyltransferase